MSLRPPNHRGSHPPVGSRELLRLDAIRQHQRPEIPQMDSSLKSHLDIARCSLKALYLTPIPHVHLPFRSLAQLHPQSRF